MEDEMSASEKEKKKICKGMVTYCSAKIFLLWVKVQKKKKRKKKQVLRICVLDIMMVWAEGGLEMLFLKKESTLRWMLGKV